MADSRSSPARPATSSHEDTATLFEAGRDGDRQSLNELVAKLSPLLWQVARAQGLDRELSQDVVQTTWLDLVRDMHKIRNPQALVGWLIITTKRESWRLRDRRHSERPLDDQLMQEQTDPAPGPDTLAVLDDRQRRLWGAVGRLSTRCRELLRIVAFIPRPDYGEIARMLGVPRSSVGPTRSRCLTKLHDLLDAEPGGEWS